MLLKTKDAMARALATKKIAKRYKTETLKTWRKRLRKNQLSTDLMIEFLTENGFILKHEMAWQLPPVVKKGLVQYPIDDSPPYDQLISEPQTKTDEYVTDKTIP